MKRIWMVRLSAGTAALLFMMLLLAGTPSVLAQRDRTPPTTPVLSVTQVDQTAVTLGWTQSTDSGSAVTYQVLMDGSPVVYGTKATSAQVQGLAPGTTYIFTVRARDNSMNWSPTSNAVSVTTLPSDPNDTTPPTTPGNLWGFDGGCGEAWLTWEQSTDNVDPQHVIRYEVYVNGIHRPESMVIGRGKTVAYAVVEGENRIEVFAQDVAGNVSAPAVVVMYLYGLCQ